MPPLLFFWMMCSCFYLLDTRSHPFSPSPDIPQPFGPLSSFTSFLSSLWDPLHQHTGRLMFHLKILSPPSPPSVTSHFPASQCSASQKSCWYLCLQILSSHFHPLLSSCPSHSNETALVKITSDLCPRPSPPHLTDLSSDLTQWITPSLKHLLPLASREPPGFPFRWPFLLSLCYLFLLISLTSKHQQTQGSIPYASSLSALTPWYCSSRPSNTFCSLRTQIFSLQLGPLSNFRFVCPASYLAFLLDVYLIVHFSFSISKT